MEMFLYLRGGQWELNGQERDAVESRRRFRRYARHCPGRGAKRREIPVTISTTSSHLIKVFVIVSTNYGGNK